MIFFIFLLFTVAAQAAETSYKHDNPLSHSAGATPLFPFSDPITITQSHPLPDYKGISDELSIKVQTARLTLEKIEELLSPCITKITDLKNDIENSSSSAKKLLGPEPQDIHLTSIALQFKDTKRHINKLHTYMEKAEKALKESLGKTTSKNSCHLNPFTPSTSTSTSPSNFTPPDILPQPVDLRDFPSI
ncbi:MAG TPA: hypothetical protein VEK38_01225, partial [Candidatus Bathyarchaeia archaeon]|nr:hypothetical protein [Candidatus Bathyarchaeia archaeon]